MLITVELLDFGMGSGVCIGTIKPGESGEDGWPYCGTAGRPLLPGPREAGRLNRFPGCNRAQVWVMALPQARIVFRNIPVIIVFEPDDVVLFKVFPNLNLDNLEGDLP